ncbi:DUF6807 family protein [Streptomyces sp. NPDC020681]|uniref:DUF6807 family protein n=1 Tax=Streptomyces sp. NPDC020681 TaxID=3365083 RepID=UPI0037A7A77B
MHSSGCAWPGPPRSPSREHRLDQSPSGIGHVTAIRAPRAHGTSNDALLPQSPERIKPPAIQIRCPLSARPENDHLGRNGSHPAHCFVRNDPFALVAPSWSFFDELVLEPGENLSRRYRVIVATGSGAPGTSAATSQNTRGEHARSDGRRGEREV